MKTKLKKEEGFTLIELLIVIGIIAILAAAVIITITPGERLKDARESTRASHMVAIGNAFHIKVVEDGDIDSIDDILDHADCGTTSADDWFEMNDACAQRAGMGSVPVEPGGEDYCIATDAADASGRVYLCTTDDESAYHCGNTDNCPIVDADAVTNAVIY